MSEDRTSITYGIGEKVTEEMRLINILNDIEGKQSSFPIFPDNWADLDRKLGKDQSIFTFISEKQLPDLPENRVKVAIAYMRQEKDIPLNYDWLTDNKMPIPTDPIKIGGSFLDFIRFYSRIDKLFHGNQGNNYYGGIYKIESVQRHGVRSAGLALYIYNQIDWDKAINMGLSKKDLAPSVYGALFHDWGRLFTQDLLTHDKLEEQFFKGINLRSDIPESIHKPVPRNRDSIFESDEASQYDTVQQAIVRICDLFGKVDKKGNLRQSISESFLNSIERQRVAALKNDAPYVNDPEWEENLILYCHRESLVLEAAVKKLGVLGVDVFECLKKINANPNVVGGYLPNLIK